MFNGIVLSVRGRPKSLESTLLKLALNADYKKYEDLTDLMANTFAAESIDDSFVAWLGIIDRLDQSLTDGARFQIK